MALMSEDVGDGDDDITLDHDPWDNDSAMYCLECGHAGIGYDFLISTQHETQSTP